MMLPPHNDKEVRGHLLTSQRVRIKTEWSHTSPSPKWRRSTLKFSTHPSLGVLWRDYIANLEAEWFKHPAICLHSSFPLSVLPWLQIFPPLESSVWIANFDVTCKIMSTLLSSQFKEFSKGNFASVWFIPYVQMRLNDIKCISIGI